MISWYRENVNDFLLSGRSVSNYTKLATFIMPRFSKLAAKGDSAAAPGLEAAVLKFSAKGTIHKQN